MQIFEIGAKRPLDPKSGPRGPNPQKPDCLGPGESVDTHIVEFSEKSADFFVWSLKALGAKIWTQGLNPLKTDCLGPGKSIHTRSGLTRKKNSTTHFLLEGHLVCHMPKAHIATLIG